MVEGLGVSQVFAFVPLYLREMGVAEPDRLRFVGIFGSLIFIVGAPLVPLWGVWADKYSRKAVIARSALVEAVVFAGVALSREPWQLALSMLLVGFQLGNTGVMLAAIRDVVPIRRLGVLIAIFGVSGPVGFAVGPMLGGFIVDGLGLPLSAIFWVSSALSVGTALLVALGSREVRPEVVPKGRVVALAFGAVRGVLSDPAVRRIFAIFGIAFLASQMSRPYIPVLVEQVNRNPAGVASAIALVAGTAALVGALVSPIGGWIGDRIGFRPVLVAALVGGALRLARDAGRRHDPGPGGDRRRRSPHAAPRSARWCSACSRSRSRPSDGRRRSTSSTCRSTSPGSSARPSARSSSSVGLWAPFWVGAADLRSVPSVAWRVPRRRRSARWASGQRIDGQADTARRPDGAPGTACRARDAWGPRRARRMAVTSRGRPMPNLPRPTLRRRSQAERIAARDAARRGADRGDRGGRAALGQRRAARTRTTRPGSRPSTASTRSTSRTSSRATSDRSSTRTTSTCSSSCSSRASTRRPAGCSRPRSTCSSGRTS